MAYCLQHSSRSVYSSIQSGLALRSWTLKASWNLRPVRSRESFLESVLNMGADPSRKTLKSALWSVTLLRIHLPSPQIFSYHPRGWSESEVFWMSLQFQQLQGFVLKSWAVLILHCGTGPNTSRMPFFFRSHILGGGGEGHLGLGSRGFGKCLYRFWNGLIQDVFLLHSGEPGFLAFVPTADQCMHP